MTVWTFRITESEGLFTLNQLLWLAGEKNIKQQANKKVKEGKHCWGGDVGDQKMVENDVKRMHDWRNMLRTEKINRGIV